jgi:SNF2 family DNA or RNA helicase
MCRHKLRKTDYQIFEKEDEFTISDNLKNAPSSKIRSVLNKIQEILAKHNEKVVVFTQFKDIINILKHNIREMFGAGKAVTLRGELNANQRTQVLQTYKTDPRASVLICSMKVGGVGLNLTNANHVVIVDPVTTNLLIKYCNIYSGGTLQLKTKLWRECTASANAKRSMSGVLSALAL